MKQRLLCLFILLALLVCPLARADLGDFSDYSDDPFVLTSSYAASSYSNNKYSYSQANSKPQKTESFFESRIWPILSVVLLRQFFAYLRSRKIKKTRQHAKHYLDQDTDILTEAPAGVDVLSLKPVSELQHFDAAKFVLEIPNKYIKLMDAVASGDLIPVKSFFTEKYFRRLTREVKHHAPKKHLSNHIERIVVSDAKLLGYVPSFSGNSESLYLSLRTRFVNYTTDKAGNIISGSNSDEILMQYEWTMERSIDNVLIPKARTSDWLISGIKSISRQTRKRQND